MLNKLLEVIDLESVCIRLRHLMIAEDRQRFSSNLPDLAKVITIPDMEILAGLLPEDELKSLLNGSFMSLHALNFALRHRLTQAHWLLSFTSCHIDQQKLAQRLPVATDDWFSDGGFLSACFDLRQGHAPMIGFSPAGVHIQMHPLRTCRAFDINDIISCSGTPTTETPLCVEHQQEGFWIDDKGRTIQSTMYSYFAAKSNYSATNEEELATLIGRFWHNIRIDQSRQSSRKEVDAALTKFGLNAQENLYELGAKGLRSRYLALCFDLHPDSGGDDQAFIDLKRDYQILFNLVTKG